MKDFSQKIWAERFRPTSFDTYVFSNPELEDKCMNWLEEGVFPHLILAGIQGTGKSSLARVLINEFKVNSSDVMFVDGSVYNKVDDMRNRIIPFTDISALGNFKVVVIEEAHRLTADAQRSLYETIERKSDHVRFIFTTNYPKKIEAPIHSRCTVFHFNSFNEEAVLALIEHILEETGCVNFDDISDESIENIGRHISTFKPDIRAIISSIQHSIFDGQVRPPSSSIVSSSISEWEEIWAQEDLTVEDMEDLFSMVTLVDNTNFEVFYTAIYEKGLHHFGELKGDAVVLISDYLARAMNVGTQGIQSIHMEALLHSLFGLGGDE